MIIADPAAMQKQQGNALHMAFLDPGDGVHVGSEDVLRAIYAAYEKHTDEKEM